jgi:hypothetical protein
LGYDKKVRLLWDRISPAKSDLKPAAQAMSALLVRMWWGKAGTAGRKLMRIS